MKETDLTFQFIKDNIKGSVWYVSVCVVEDRGNYYFSFRYFQILHYWEDPWTL